MAMTLRLSDEETEALRVAAEAEGVSMQEYARRVIRESTSGWAIRREAFLKTFVKENEGLLKRLGE